MLFLDLRETDETFKTETRLENHQDKNHFSHVSSHTKFSLFNEHRLSLIGYFLQMSLITINKICQLPKIVQDNKV